jgi:hypothetical protein
MADEWSFDLRTMQPQVRRLDEVAAEQSREIKRLRDGLAEIRGAACPERDGWLIELVEHLLKSSREV